MDESYKGGPPKTAKEDNRPPKRTTVRRRGQQKRTTENWTLSNRRRTTVHWNRRRTTVHWNRRRTTVHWNSTLTMGDTSIGIEGRRTEMTIGCRQRTKWPTRRMPALRIGSSTTDEVDADRRVGVSSRNDTTEDGVQQDFGRRRTTGAMVVRTTEFRVHGQQRQFVYCRGTPTTLRDASVNDVTSTRQQLHPVKDNWSLCSISLVGRQSVVYFVLATTNRLGCSKLC